MPAKTTDQIAALEKRIAQQNARLEALRARNSTAERKARNHRLFALAAMIESAGPEVVAAAIARYGHLVRARRDRAALGLPEAPPPVA